MNKLQGDSWDRALAKMASTEGILPAAIQKRLTEIWSDIYEIQEADAHYRRFLEAALRAPIAANFHPAPRAIQ